MGNMFSECYNLVSIDISNIYLTTASNLECIFDDCNSLCKILVNKDSLELFKNKIKEKHLLRI